MGVNNVHETTCGGISQSITKDDKEGREGKTSRHHYKWKMKYDDVNIVNIVNIIQYSSYLPDNFYINNSGTNN